MGRIMRLGNLLVRVVILRGDDKNMMCATRTKLSVSYVFWITAFTSIRFEKYVCKVIVSGSMRKTVVGDIRI